MNKLSDIIHDNDEYEPEPMLDEIIEDELHKSNSKIELATKVLRQISENVDNVIRLLEQGDLKDAEEQLQKLSVTNKEVGEASVEEGGRIIEGVFDGENMVGSDGKQYIVPPNYASKSKLIEGDMLKLIIKADGSFVFKQIGPIDRKRIVGTLALDEDTAEYSVFNEDDRWHVLTASVTYYHGEPGDEVIILVPKGEPSKWAAVENIIRK